MSKELEYISEALLTAINALEFLEGFDYWDEEMGQVPAARPAIELCQKALAKLDISEPISAPRSPDTVCLSREVVDYVIDRLLEIVLGRNKAGQVVDFPADIANEALTKLHAEMGE